MSARGSTPRDGERRAQIARLVAARRDEATAWLRRLVATPSVAPGEAAAQQLVAELARAAGLRATLHPCDEQLERDPRFIPTGLSYRDRPNVVVEVPGGVGAPLVCNAHVDTVAPGEGWRRPPTGELVGGRLYGLGACDTKASTVAALVAAACLLECDGPTPAFALHSVVDEEPGGNGTLALLRALGDAAPRAWLAVVMEPTRLDLTLGHRGMLWYRIDCVGRQAHGATAEGVNAIELAGEVALALRALNERFDAEPAGAYGRPRVNSGIVRGGEEVYTTPGRCRLEVSARYAPGERERVAGALEQAVAATGVAVELELVGDCDAAETAADDPAVAAARAVLTAHRPDAADARLDGTCDMRHYRHRLGVPSVVFGPGDLRLAHTVEEHVDVDDVLLAAAVLAELAFQAPAEARA